VDVVCGMNSVPKQDHLIANDRGVAETLELLMDQEFMQALKESEKDVAEGKLLPMESILEE
jgi:hypothetical protein